MAGDIRLAISVDSTGAVTAVKQVNEALDQTPKSAATASAGLNALKGVMGTAAAAVTAFGVGLTAVGAFVGAQSGKLAKYSDEVVTLANKFKITTEAVQLFRIAATVGGTTIEGIATAMQKMQVAIGNGDSVFARLGLSLSSLKSMNADAALEAVAQRIAMIKAPAEQAAAAVEAFGKQGLSVLPALAEGFGELKAKAQEYGLILRGEVVQAAEAFGDRFDLVSQAWDAFLMRIGAVIANSPAVMAVLDGIGKLFGQLSGWVETNATVIEGWVKGALSLAIDGLHAFAEGLKMTILGVMSLVKASQMIFNVSGGGMFSKLFGFTPGKDFATADFGGTINALLTPIEAFQKSMIDMANAVDTSGKKIAASPLFNGSLNFAGAGAGKGGAKKAGFDLLAHSRLLELQAYAAINSNTSMAMPGITTQLSGKSLLDMPERRDPFTGVRGAGQGLMADPQFNSALHSAYAPLKKASFDVAQGLQNLANIAQVSGSKLGKTLAGIAGGGAGLAGGLGSLFGKNKTDFGDGLGGFLGKVGAWGQVASSVLSIGSSIFGLFKKKPKEPPPEPPKQATAEAWANFTGDQLGKGAAGVLAGVSGIKVTTPEDMASQGLIASTVFWQMFKEKGIMAAADAFRPVRDKMLETFKAAGADDAAIGAMLGPMSQQIDLAANEAFKGASEGSKGFADALAAIANTQMPMTLDQFRAFELQAVNGFNQMRDAAVDQGLSMEEAIKAAAMSSGTYLQTIKDAAAKYGFALGGSQSLFDDAAAAGVAFGGSSQERLIMSIDRLTETLGGAPPKFEQALQAGVSRGVRGSESSGWQQRPEIDPSAVSDPIVDAVDRLAAATASLANRPIENTVHATIGGDGALAALARAFEQGGAGAQRFQTATEGL